MINKPIKPKHVGCLCCSSVGQMLPKEKWLDVGFGEVVLTIEHQKNGRLIRSYIGGLSESEDQVSKVKDLEEEYSSMFDKAKCVTLFFNTPLHDETYEYNKEDKQWYLIKQGMGFA